MTLEIQIIHDDGSGYMVVTNDDGTTFGQNFHRAPIQDRDALLEHLSSLAEEASARNLAPAPMSPQVAASVRQPIPVTPRLPRVRP